MNLISLLNQCNQEWRQLIEFLAKQHSLTFSEWRALVCINETKNLEQQQLARDLNIAPNNMINITDTLEKKGFIKKTIKPSDKKIRILTITKRKQKTVDQITTLNKQINTSWFAKFNKKSLSEFEEMLADALNSIQTIRDKFS